MPVARAYVGSGMKGDAAIATKIKTFASKVGGRVRMLDSAPETYSEIKPIVNQRNLLGLAKKRITEEAMKPTPIENIVVNGSGLAGGGNPYLTKWQQKSGGSSLSDVLNAAKNLNDSKLVKAVKYGFNKLPKGRVGGSRTRAELEAEIARERSYLRFLQSDFVMGARRGRPILATDMAAPFHIVNGLRKTKKELEEAEREALHDSMWALRDHHKAPFDEKIIKYRSSRTDAQKKLAEHNRLVKDGLVYDSEDDDPKPLEGGSFLNDFLTHSTPEYNPVSGFIEREKNLGRIPKITKKKGGSEPVLAPLPESVSAVDSTVDSIPDISGSGKKKRAKAKPGDGRKVRAAIVSKLMKAEGLSLPAASKAVKERGLY